MQTGMKDTRQTPCVFLGDLGGRRAKMVRNERSFGGLQGWRVVGMARMVAFIMMGAVELRAKANWAAGKAKRAHNPEMKAHWVGAEIAWMERASGAEAQELAERTRRAIRRSEGDFPPRFAALSGHADFPRVRGKGCGGVGEGRPRAR